MILAQASGLYGFEPLQPFYNTLTDLTYQANGVLVHVAYILAFIGLLIEAYRSVYGDVGGTVRQIVMIALVAITIPRFPDMIFAAQELFGERLLQELDVDPISIVDKFIENVLDLGFDFDQGVGGLLVSALDIFNTIVKLLGNVVMLLISIVVWIILFFAYQVQIIALYIGCMASPIFLGMLLFPTTRQTGITYITGLVAITFWPLSWGIGLIYAEAIMDITTGIAAAMVLFTILGAFLEIIMLVIVAIWMLVVIFKGPKIVFKALTTGAQIGTGLVAAAIGTAGSAAGSAVQLATAAAAIAATATGAGAAAGIAIGAAGGAASSAIKGTSKAAGGMAE